MSNNRFEDIKSTSSISDMDSSRNSGAKNAPEIENPKPSDATKIFPDEVPRRDGPGGE